MLKKSLALLCCLMLAVSPLVGVPLPGVLTAKAADGYVWQPDFTGAYLVGNGFLEVDGDHQLGMQLGNAGDTDLTVDGNAFVIAAKDIANGQYKGITIQTGTAVGGSANYWTDGVAFKPEAGKEYKVTFDAALVATSGTVSGGQVRVRSNIETDTTQWGDWKATNLTTATTGVTYIYTQEAGGGNLQIDTGTTKGTGVCIANLKIAEVVSGGGDTPTGDVIYDMQDDLDSVAIGDFGGTAALKKSGSPTVAVVDNGDDKALSITARGENWHSIQLDYSKLGMQAGHTYTVRMTGRVTANTTIQICDTNYPTGAGDIAYQGVSSGSFTVEKTGVSYDDIISKYGGIRFTTTDKNDFIIDNIEIIDEGGSTVSVEIYNMQNDLDSVAIGDFVGTAALKKSGSPTVAVVDNGGDKALSITARGENWHSIQLDYSKLGMQAGHTYTVRMTGRVTANTTIQICDTNYPTGAGDIAYQGVSSGSFTVEKTGVSYDDIISKYGGIRFTTTDKNDFIIDNIEIIDEGGSGGGTPVTPPANSLGSTVFYDLSTDENVTGAASGTEFQTPSILELKGDDSGSPMPSVTVEGGSLYISNRSGDWYGIDVLRDEMKVGGNFVDGKYTIYVAGHIADDATIPAGDPKIKLATSESPWSTLAWQGISDENRSFELTYEKDITGDQMSKLGYNFRIQSENAPELPFYIDSLVVKVDSPVSLSFTFSPEDKAAYESWWKPGSSMELEWVEDFGNGDSYALKATRKSGNTDYNASNSGLQVVFPASLPVGQYYMSADFYAPAEGNEGKSLDEESLLFNSTGGSANHRIPSNASEDASGGTIGAWVTVEGTTVDGWTEQIKEIRFRYFGNTMEKNPDVFYLDNVVIKQLDVEVEEDYWPDPEWNFNLASIKDKYSGYFLIGNIMSPDNGLGHLYDDYDSQKMFLQHYNLVTAENAMKPINTAPTEGNYNFKDGDTLIAWAKANNIPVHGHTLVWHSQSPSWLNVGLTRAEARANMVDYITTVAEHYRGDVVSWDVVNEAMENDAKYFDGVDWRTGLRTDSPWYTAYANGADADAGESGADYIYEAFALAREIDPNATLFYNDYNEEVPNKRDAIALMVEDLNAKWKNDARYDGRLLIECIGMQSHHWVGNFNASNVEAAIRRFAATGARIAVTELDMPYGTYANQHPSRKLTKEQEIEQAVNYAKLFTIYKKYASNIDRVTFWAMADAPSWRAFGMPVLFDNSLRVKESYYAVMNPEQYLKDHAGSGSSSSSSSSSSGGGGGGGGGSSTVSNAPAPVNQASVVGATNQAVTEAKKAGSNTAAITLKNVGEIKLNNMKAITKAAKDIAVKLNADSMNGTNVDVRITIDPSKATKDINLYASTTSQAAKSAQAKFEKYYDNKVLVISLSQQGDFGMPVEIAAKVSKDLDTKTLVFYSYDKATNSYKLITDPKYWIDKNGYVHFTTTLAGDIIVTDKPLTKK